MEIALLKQSSKYLKVTFAYAEEQGNLEKDALVDMSKSWQKSCMARI